DTASIVLFGGLQQITSELHGLSVILMAPANSSAGETGKLIDAQSIVGASTATGYIGQESKILRFVVWHAIVLACLVGGLVFLQLYVYPCTEMLIHPSATAPAAH
ncbi:L-lactate permease, partial [Methylobacterium sp. J-043]|nr:L-lactate permease [Methylobacterium sp. J-043]